MEESEQHKKQQTIQAQSQTTSIRLYNRKRLFWIVTAITLVAIVVALILILVLRGPAVSTRVISTELLNLTYSIALENGTIVDSGTDVFNVGTVASSLGFKTNKLDSEIATMAKGEEKIITLEAVDAYGNYDERLAFRYNRTERMPRENEMNKIQTITLDEFKETFDEQPQIGKDYSVTGAPWPYKVLNKSETDVTLSQQATLGTRIPIPGSPFIYEVVKVTDDKITLKVQGNDSIMPTAMGNLEIKFTDDYIISTLTPEIGQEIELPRRPKARVIKLDANYIYLDANHLYAGKKIIMTIKLLDKKEVKEEGGITGFVTCLDRAGFKIYGANWCGWTQRLVDEFGGYDVIKPIYIECTEQQALCNEKGIRGYPTILIKDKPFAGQRTFEEFAKATGCKAPENLILKRNVQRAPEGSC